MIRNSGEAAEVETNSWYDFIYCRFCDEGTRVETGNMEEALLFATTFE